MKFLCGSCRTKYQISEDKVRGKILTIRCQKCGSKVRVREGAKGSTEPVLAEVVGADSSLSSMSSLQSVATPTPLGKQKAGVQSAITKIPTSDLGIAPVAHGSDSDEAPTRVGEKKSKEENVEWFSAIDGKQSGPFSFSELIKKIGARELLAQHYVWNQHMDGWKRIREVPDLAAKVPKATPPPPPLKRPQSAEERALGEVVDLAEKRAELERTKKVDLTSNARLKSLIARPDEQEEQTVQEGGVSDRTPVPTISRRPARSTATPVALVSTTPVAGGSAAPDLNLDLAADLFAGLPRVQTDDDMQPLRESTRFFVAAAGINRRKSRNMAGLVIGAACFIAFGSFITAWAAGFVSIPIPAAVNPFAKATNDADEEEEETEIDENDPNVRALAGENRARRRKKARVVRMASSSTERPGEGGPRGDGEPEVIKFNALGESKLVGEVPAAQLPESRPEEMLVPDQKELSPEVVNAVIAARKGSVRSCYQEFLRANENLRGKVLFEITVKPSGDVARVNVLSREHRAGIGGCIADRMRDWKFPSFEGRENAIVQANFVLEKNY